MVARAVDDDDELLARAGRGDQAAIRRLVDSKTPRVLALAARMLSNMDEAEDVAQEAFVRIWQVAPRWRPAEARFDTWLHRVTLNLCYDRLRRRRPMSELSVEIADSGPPPDRDLLARDLARSVDAAIGRLPLRQREAIILCHYQDLSNIEAASVMEISVEALESLLSRGRRTLRALLAEFVNHG